MDINLGDVKILIKAENLDKALKDAKSAFECAENVRSDEWKSIEDAFDEFGYNLITNDTGDVVDLDVISSDLPDGQQAFFESIAESVESGSYVCLKREDEHWKFVFEKGKFRTLDSEIVYYDKPMSYDRAMCLLNEVVDRVYVSENVSEAIKHLFTLGFTDDELINVFDIASSDVEAVVKRIEEGDR